MEKLLMVLMICVSAKAVENKYHPKFVRAFEEYERLKTREASTLEKLSCTSSIDHERDRQTTKATCGEPKEVFHEINDVPRAAHEEIHPAAVWVQRCVGLCNHEGANAQCVPKETTQIQIPIYPAAVWVKRCIGLCDDHGLDSKCRPKETIKHQIPIKIVNTKTSKESCSHYSIEEHVSCSCQRCSLNNESCKADGMLFNPRTCSCRCPNYKDRRACFAQKQTMR